MKTRFTLIAFLAGAVVLAASACAGPAGPVGPSGPAGPQGPAGPAGMIPTPTVIIAPGTTGEPVGPPSTGNGTTSATGVYGIGRDATDEEFAAWIIDITPDGRGLPAGSGTPAQGATFFASTCAPCHGADGKGTPLDANEVLIGTDPWYELGNPVSVGPHTIGNYWQYATTLYDYIRRAMPFSAPESLTNEQVYQVVAWLLNQNGIIADGEVMNSTTLPKVVMPNQDGFVPDPRPWPEVQ